MAIKDRLRSARGRLSPNSRPTLFASSSALSASSSLTKTSTTSSSTKSSASSANTSTSSSSTSRLSNLFRSRRSDLPGAEEWVHPPLKYSDPPQQEYVDLLAAWDWDSACNHTFAAHNALVQSPYATNQFAYGTGYGYGVNIWNGADSRYDVPYGYANGAAAPVDRRLECAAGRVVKRQRSWDSCVSPGTTSRRGSADWDNWI